MDRSQLIREVRTLKPALAKMGVAHLAIFGSRARGDRRPDSDVDGLVDVDPVFPFSLLDLIGVEQLIEDAAGVPANAVMRRSLDDSFKRSIGSDLIAVF